MKDLLDPHQVKAVWRAVKNYGMAVWWRPGLGKTRVALAAFARLAKNKKVPVFLYVCRRAAFQDVRDEVDNLGLDWHVSEFGNGPMFNMRQMMPTLVLISNGMLARHIHVLTSIPFRILGIAFDEGFLYKNPHAAITKAANKISRGIPHRLILSGSIMTARNIEDVFGQMYAMDEHERLARTLTDFRSKYMVGYEISTNISTFNKYAPRRGALNSIGRKLAPIISVRFPKHETIVRKIIRHVECTPNQQRLIKQLATEYYCKYKDVAVEVKNALSITIKAQQISNGYLSNEDGDIIHFPTNKTAAVCGLIQELHEAGERCVIWTAFRHDLKILEDSLPFEIATIASGASNNQLATASRRKIVAITEAYGSSFNVLAQFPYAIYFSMNHKWLDLQQSMHRTTRRNSKHPIAFYYFFLVKDSLDSLVYKAANDSKKKEKELINTLEIKQCLGLQSSKTI